MCIRDRYRNEPIIRDWRNRDFRSRSTGQHIPIPVNKENKRSIITKGEDPNGSTNITKLRTSEYVRPYCIQEWPSHQAPAGKGAQRSWYGGRTPQKQVLMQESRRPGIPRVQDSQEFMSVIGFFKEKWSLFSLRRRPLPLPFFEARGGRSSLLRKKKGSLSLEKERSYPL